MEPPVPNVAMKIRHTRLSLLFIKYLGCSFSQYNFIRPYNIYIKYILYDRSMEKYFDEKTCRQVLSLMSSDDMFL